MSRGYGQAPASPKLSSEAAQAIYDKIAAMDKVIDAAIAAVTKANCDIATAVKSANDVYAQRRQLAEELALHSDAEWSPTKGQSAMAPAAPGWRFARNMPFPYVNNGNLNMGGSPFPPAPQPCAANPYD